MCGWSQSPPSQARLQSQSPPLPPSPTPTFCSCHLSIFTFRFTHDAWSRSLEMTATAGGLHNAAPLSHFPTSSPPLADWAAVVSGPDIQSHVTVWGPQTFGRRSARVGIQAVTAVLTNYVRTSAGKCGYLYRLKPPQQPGDKTETQHGGGGSGGGGGREGEGRNKGADVKKEAKRAAVWQHNHWASAELLCKRNTSFYFLSRPPPVILLHSYGEASSHAAREGAVRERRRGVNERWK